MPVMDAAPAEPFDPVDAHWMRQAIALSESALAVTAPNPRVACLIVRDGQCLASGVTQRAGGAHAEVMALREAQTRGVSLEGTTFYVTLEPCSHHGRTPPCADAIVRAAPARVVLAMIDPNPRVAGQGIHRLRQAGIPVTVGVCAEEALAINPGFVARMTRGTPWVWLKSAVSLDGRVALPDGRSQWITGAAARRDGHHWRARSCAVMTGIGTVLADDPQLNVRHVDTPRQPLRVVVDSTLRMPLDARMLKTARDALNKSSGQAGAAHQTVQNKADAVAARSDGGARRDAGDALVLASGGVLIFTASDDADKTRALQARGAHVVRLSATAQGVDLPAALRWLGQHAINEVHVEAGGRLSGALLQAGLVDELLVYVAPVLLGDGMPMARLPGLPSLSQAPRYTFLPPHRLGEDLRLRLRREDRWQALLSGV